MGRTIEESKDQGNMYCRQETTIWGRTLGATFGCAFVGVACVVCDVFGAVGLLFVCACDVRECVFRCAVYIQVCAVCVVSCVVVWCVLVVCF